MSSLGPRMLGLMSGWFVICWRVRFSTIPLHLQEPVYLTAQGPEDIVPPTMMLCHECHKADWAKDRSLASLMQRSLVSYGFRLTLPISHPIYVHGNISWVHKQHWIVHRYSCDYVYLCSSMSSDAETSHWCAVCVPLVLNGWKGIVCMHTGALRPSPWT